MGREGARIDALMTEEREKRRERKGRYGIGCCEMEKKGWDDKRRRKKY